jgi:hypothetical protein
VSIAAVHIRATPEIGCYVDHNVINSEASDTGVNGDRPIYEAGSTENMFVTQNYWKGTLYPTGTGIVSYQ